MSNSTEVELPLDPYEGLSSRLTAMLEKAVLGVSWERGLAVLDAFQEILAELTIASTEAGVGTDHSEDMIVTPSTTIPPTLLHQLAREFEAASTTSRVILVECLRDLVGEWYALFTDDEKLIGHLCTHHGMGWTTGRTVIGNDRILDTTIARDMRKRHWDFHRSSKTRTAR